MAAQLELAQPAPLFDPAKNLFDAPTGIDRRAMSERENAYLGGERTRDKKGRGTENKIPIVGAVSQNEAGHLMVRPASAHSPR